jgi:hypothetical protein
MKDIAQSWGITATVLAVINVLTLKEWLSCLLIAVTVGYTVWKWRRDVRKDKNNSTKPKGNTDEDDEG